MCWVRVRVSPASRYCGAVDRRLSVTVFSVRNLLTYSVTYYLLTCRGVVARKSQPANVLGATATRNGLHARRCSCPASTRWPCPHALMSRPSAAARCLRCRASRWRTRRTRAFFCLTGQLLANRFLLLILLFSVFFTTFSVISVYKNHFLTEVSFGPNAI